MFGERMLAPVILLLSVVVLIASSSMLPTTAATTAMTYNLRRSDTNHNSNHDRSLVDSTSRTHQDSNAMNTAATEDENATIVNHQTNHRALKAKKSKEDKHKSFKKKASKKKQNGYYVPVGNYYNPAKNTKKSKKKKSSKNNYYYYNYDTDDTEPAPSSSVVDGIAAPLFISTVADFVRTLDAEIDFLLGVPLRVRALVFVRWPRTGKPTR